MELYRLSVDLSWSLKNMIEWCVVYWTWRLWREKREHENRLLWVWSVYQVRGVVFWVSVFPRSHVVIVYRPNGVGAMSHGSDCSLSYTTSWLHGGVVQETIVLSGRSLQNMVGMDLSSGVVICNPIHWESLYLGILLQSPLHVHAADSIYLSPCTYAQQM
jgi:hypothetical protein